LSFDKRERSGVAGLHSLDFKRNAPRRSTGGSRLIHLAASSNKFSIDHARSIPSATAATRPSPLQIC